VATAVIDAGGNRWERRENERLRQCGECRKPLRVGATVWEHRREGEIPGEPWFYWRCNACATGEPEPQGQRTPRGYRYGTFHVQRLAGDRRVRGVRVYRGSLMEGIDYPGYYVAEGGRRARTYTITDRAGNEVAYQHEDGFPGRTQFDHLGQMVDSMYRAFKQGRLPAAEARPE
jgi:hypothetical protein